MPFYQAYCKTESKDIGQASSDKTVAENNKKNHERNNEGHDVEVRET